MTETESPTVSAPKSPAISLTGGITDRTFLASRFKQGSRTVYAFTVPLSVVLTLIPEPNPNESSIANRAIRVQHAIDFGKYVRDNEEWIAPSLILRTSSSFKFDTQFEADGEAIGLMSIPLTYRDLHILDGQHRTLGLFDAAKKLSAEVEKQESMRDAAKRQGDGNSLKEIDARIKDLRNQQKRLDSERIAIQIYVEKDLRKYRQMFADMAENQIGISGSVRARFDSTKVVNRVLSTLVEGQGHPLANEHTIEPERPRVRDKSEKFISALGLANVIRAANVGFIGRYTNRAEAEAKDDVVLKNTAAFLNNLIEAFPLLDAFSSGRVRSVDVRDYSLLGSPLFLKMLAGVQHSLITEHAFTNEMVVDYFKQLAPHLEVPIIEDSIWDNAPAGSMPIGQRQPNGRKQESAQLVQALIDWAIEKPAFLGNKAPERVIEEPVAVEEMTEEQIDAELRPEITKARATRSRKGAGKGE